MLIHSNLRLRHLSCFLEIAKVGSLVAAADRLAISQPAVSKTLRELEEMLGVQLFDRSGRRLSINAHGRVFQRRVGNAFSEIEQAGRAVTGGDGRVSRISVGALPTAAGVLVPRAVLAMRETHPFCRLRASTGPNWLLRSQLLDGDLDIVVGRMAPSEQMDGLSFEQLYPEDVVAVVRSDHPQSGELGLNDLLSYPLIIPPKGAVIGPIVRDYLTGIGAGDIQPFVDTVSLPIGREIVLNSDAIWFISRGVIDRELREGVVRAVELNQPMFTGPVGLYLRKDGQIGPELQALISHLRGVAQGM
ncbi:MAG: LysR substrate-binding domain-containing protein [Pikeienuella sp.]